MPIDQNGTYGNFQNDQSQGTVDPNNVNLNNNMNMGYSQNPYLNK